VGFHKVCHLQIAMMQKNEEAPKEGGGGL